MPLSVGRLRGMIPILKADPPGSALAGAIQVLKPAVTPEPLFKPPTQANPVMGGRKDFSGGVTGPTNFTVSNLQRRSKGRGVL